MPRTAGCWPGSALPAKPLSRREKEREREEGASRAGRETRGRVGGPEAAGPWRGGRGGAVERRVGGRAPGRPGSGGAGGAGAHSLAAQLHHLLDGGVAGRQEELRVLLHSEGLQPLGHRAERRALGAAGAGQPDGHPATADTGLRVSPPAAPPGFLIWATGTPGQEALQETAPWQVGSTPRPRLLPPPASTGSSASGSHRRTKCKRAGFSEPRPQPDHLPACKIPDCSCLFPHLQKGDNYRTISSAV